MLRQILDVLRVQSAEQTRRKSDEMQTNRREEGDQLGDIFCWVWLHWQIWSWLVFPGLKPDLPCAGAMAWALGCSVVDPPPTETALFHLVLLAINKNKPTLPASNTVSLPFIFLCTNWYSIMFIKCVISSRKSTGQIPKCSAALWYACRAETRERGIKTSFFSPTSAYWL